MRVLPYFEKSVIFEKFESDTRTVVHVSDMVYGPL